ncbi:MAG: class I SAM-dependent methyltransferase [Planctomycetota bacterium]|jgi:hypothetical protein
MTNEKKKELADIRHSIVWAGKHSDKFKKLAKTRDKADPKYAELDNMADTGAISNEDCYLLYSLVCRWRPKTIVEIGTWFGTSAVIMARAMMDVGVEGKIYTCDKHDVYVPLSSYEPNVKYYNMHSEKFLKKMIGRKLMADMFFIDASLKKGDQKSIKELSGRPIRIVGHDYDAKGLRNVNKLKEVFQKVRLEIHGICFIMTAE